MAGDLSWRPGRKGHTTPGVNDCGSLTVEGMLTCMTSTKGERPADTITAIHTEAAHLAQTMTILMAHQNPIHPDNMSRILQRLTQILGDDATAAWDAYRILGAFENFHLATTSDPYPTLEVVEAAHSATKILQDAITTATTRRPSTCPREGTMKIRKTRPLPRLDPAELHHLAEQIDPDQDDVDDDIHTPKWWKNHHDQIHGNRTHTQPHWPTN
jgi:hypothetical protein